MNDNLYLIIIIFLKIFKDTPDDFGAGL